MPIDIASIFNSIQFVYCCSNEKKCNKRAYNDNSDVIVSSKCVLHQLLDFPGYAEAIDRCFKRKDFKIMILGV